MSVSSVPNVEASHSVSNGAIGGIVASVGITIITTAAIISLLFYKLRVERDAQAAPGIDTVELQNSAAAPRTARGETIPGGRLSGG